MGDAIQANSFVVECANSEVTGYNYHVVRQGRLRDYAHKEWNIILHDFHYNRWEI